MRIYPTRSLLALLLAILLIIVPGCGSRGIEPEDPSEAEPEEDATEREPEQETDDSDDDAVLTLDAWESPTTMASIVAGFSRLEWRWAIIDAGVEGDPTHVTYIYEGRETVDSEDTDKITLTFDDQEWTIWLDANGNPKQVSSGGEVMPGQIGENMARAIVTMVVTPFRMTQVFPVRDVLLSRTPGWSYSELSRSTESFGDLSAEVTRLQVTALPPAVPEGEVNVLWGIADFGDFQMLVDWGVVLSEEGEHAFSMKIEKVERR